MEKSEALSEISRVLESITVPDHAAAARSACVVALKKAGWSCRTEVKVPTRGDSRRGFVDIEATKEGVIAGIEVDNRNPRAKSAIKLLTREWLRVIATRGVPAIRFREIDLHVSLNVRQ